MKGNLLRNSDPSILPFKFPSWLWDGEDPEKWECSQMHDSPMHAGCVLINRPPVTAVPRSCIWRLAMVSLELKPP